MDTPKSFIPIRVAQTLGITLSSLLGGSTLSLSIFLVPRILESPAPLLLQQWQHMYDIGKKTGPPISLLAASAYFYLAYTLPPSYLGGRSSFWRYVVAGVLSAGIAPYTFACMLGTNKKLLGRAEGVSAVMKGGGEEIVETQTGEETAHSLVDWWGVLNLGRGIMLAASGILGVWTALE